MKISNTLPKYSQEDALFIVLSKSNGAFYEAKKGNISHIDSFTVDKDTYTDNEGFFERGGKGQVFGSGSVLEPNKREEYTRLVKSFKKKCKDNDLNKYDDIYIFCPDYLSKKIRNALPHAKSHVEIFRGNYQHVHPFALLKMVQSRQIQKKKIHISFA